MNNEENEEQFDAVLFNDSSHQRHVIGASSETFYHEAFRACACFALVQQKLWR
jgi:hypothetical protein